MLSTRAGPHSLYRAPRWSCWPPALETAARLGGASATTADAGPGSPSCPTPCMAPGLRRHCYVAVTPLSAVARGLSRLAWPSGSPTSSGNHQLSLGATSPLLLSAAPAKLAENPPTIVKGHIL